MKYMNVSPSGLTIATACMVATCLTQICTATSGTNLFNVPSEYPTIQSAVDAASSGDLIVVDPGTYLENVVISEKTITLRSSEGAASTVIDGQGSGRVLEITGAGSSGSTLEGFTISSGYASDTGGGLLVSGAEISISECVFLENSALGAGAIQLNSSTFDIGFCSFIRNNAFGPQASGRTGGIWNQSGSGLIHDCVFDSNSTAFENGMDVYSHSAPGGTTIERCSFTAPDLTEADVHHICLYNHVGSMLVRDSTFHDISWGGVVFSWSDPVLEDCTIKRITTKGAVGLSQGATTLNGCSFSDCIVPEGHFLFSPYLPNGAQVEIFDGYLCGIDGEINNGGTVFDDQTLIEDECDDILDVPEDYLTIQQAIDASVNGDVIRVAPGNHAVPAGDGLDPSGKAIEIRGTLDTSGYPTTLITAEPGGRLITFDADETSATIMSGFILTGGSNTLGGAMLIQDSSPSIVSCTFVGNSAEQGGALAIDGGSPLIDECIFSSNTATAISGGAISCFSDASPVIRGTTIDQNVSTGVGGGIHASGGSLSLEGCSFTSNRGSIGGGAKLDNCSFIIENSSFETNVATGPNSTYGSGGAMNVSAGGGEIIDTSFIRNQSKVCNAGGIMFEAGASPTLSGCVFTTQSAPPDEEDSPYCLMVYNAPGSNPTFDECQFVDIRTYTLERTCIFSWGSPTITNCLFSNVSGRELIFANCGSSTQFTGNRVEYCFHEEEGGSLMRAECGGSITVRESEFCSSDENIHAGNVDFDGSNTISESCSPPCPWDLSGNRFVDGQDLSFLLAAWGDVDSFPAADLTGDGEVNGADLSTLLGFWGPCR